MEAMDYWRTPATVQKYYVDDRHGQVHVRDNGVRAGTALPIIIIHPMPVSGRMFVRLLEALTDSRYAVAMDLPGYGLSDKLTWPPSISDYADMALEIMDQLALGPAAIFAYHAGASKIAVDMALKRPEQIEALLLVSAPIFDPDDPQLQNINFGAVPLQEDGTHLSAFWKELTRGSQDARALPAIQRDVAEALLPYPNHWWGYQASHMYDLSQTLPRVQQPVLLVNIDNPMHAPTERAAPLINNGRFVDRSDWAQGFQDTSAGDVAALIDEFLTGHKKVEALAPIVQLRLPEAGKVRRAYGRGPYGPLHYRLAEPEDPKQTPLTCFHASPQSGLVYEALLKVMGRDRIALAPDTPGFGESEAPLTPPGIEDYAAAMAALLDDLGIQQTDVMGFHTGSMTAIELARQRPDLVRKIVMISAPIFTDEELAAFKAHYTHRDYEPDGSHNVLAWQRFWKWRGPNQTIENYARNNAQGMRGGPVSEWGHQAAFNYPLAEHLPEIDKPILVLNSDDDLVEHTRRAPPLMKNGRVHELPHLGHGMLDFATEEIAGLMKEFLD